MNILDKIPSIVGSKDEPEMTEAEAKSERMRFHREKVRNGPASFRTMSNGQIRRAQKRMEASRVRKARRRQIRSYLTQQNEAAALRGNLQAAGVIAYVHEGTTMAPEAALQSIVWIVKRFAEGDESGRVEVTSDTVTKALTAALNRYQALTGQEQTPLSPAYVLPVRVSA